MKWVGKGCDYFLGTGIRENRDTIGRGSRSIYLTDCQGWTRCVSQRQMRIKQALEVTTCNVLVVFSCEDRDVKVGMVTFLKVF